MNGPPTLSAALGALSALLVLAPIYAGLNDALTDLLAGRRPAPPLRHARLLADLLRRRGATGMALPAAAALAATMIAAALVPDLVSGDGGRTLVVVGFVALLSAARAAQALDPAAAAALSAAADARGHVPAVVAQPALLLALLTTALSQTDPAAGGLAAAGFALAAWTSNEGQAGLPRSAGLARDPDEAAAMERSGPSRGLTLVTVQLRQIVLWTVWGTCLVPWGSGAVAWGSVPALAAAALAAKLLLVAVAVSMLRQRPAASLFRRSGSAAATAFALSSGALLLAVVGGGAV